MAEIQVKVVDIKKLKITAENFKVSISCLPEEDAIFENVIKVTISGIRGNVQSFLTNAVDEGKNTFKGKVCFPSCF